MDLIERYVHAVRFWLPRAQQDDVAAELAEDIHSQIEEQEGKLGRKLTELEVASLLKERGRPMLVANRYRPQQYLIGPLLFPVYRLVMILVALGYAVPWTLTWISLVIFDPFYRSHFGAGATRVWGNFIGAILVAFGAVTLIFVLLDRVQPNLKFLKDWDPGDLPAVRDPNRISRINSTVEIAANLALAVWWLTDMWSTTAFNWSTTIFDRGGVRIILAPVWKYFLWAFLLIAVANIVLAAANLARPYWTWLRASFQLVLTSAGSVAFCWICKAHLLEQIVVPNLPPARAAQIVTAINTYAAKSFPFAVMASVLIVALSGVGRIVRLRKRPTPQMQSAIV